VVAKVSERLEVRKQAAQNSDGGRFNLRKLNDLEVRKQYQIEITNRFAALENVSEGEDINRALESIKENIKTSATEILFRSFSCSSLISQSSFISYQQPYRRSRRMRNTVVQSQRRI